MPRRGIAARTLLGAAVLLTVVLAPTAAFAHAELASSSPAPGARLGAAPGIVVLRFSEALTPKLSTATVIDPSGAGVRGTASDTMLRIPLATNLPGQYVVRWTAVSADDGHTESGSFGFSVVADRLPGGGAVARSERPDPVAAIARTLQFAALLFCVGTVVVAALARREPRLAWVRSHLRAALVIALTSSVVVVLSDAARASGSASAGRIVAYLTTGLPGLARVALLVAEALAIVGTMVGASVSPALVAAVVALAASGHGASVRPAWWGIAVDAGHLLAAGVWAGGIMALAVLRPPGGWRTGEARELLDRFSPLAFTAFVMTVAFGTVQAVQDVGRVSNLLGTSYGRTLAVKIGLVAAMVPLSLLAWRRRLAPRAEAAIAVFVVGAAALLAAYPLPSLRPVPASAAGPSRAAATSAFPRPGDLTLGGHAGQVLLGLTVRPARPGPNELLVYVLPLEGQAQDVPITVSVGDREQPVRPCGPNCRRTEADIEGGERVSVHAGGPAAGTATFDLPRLPVPDGSALLDAAQRRMHALRTFRLDEVLDSGLATVHSTYAFQAPDRTAITVSGRSRQILIGGTRYLSDGPNLPWRVQAGGPTVPVPAFIWDFFGPYVDPRVIGSETVRGAATNVVSFFGRSGTDGVWLRLWIDGDGLVRRAQMRADGHFMDQRYFAFDAPLSIVPPVDPGPEQGG